MKERIRQFMSGRYGMDDLGQFLNIVIIVILVLSLFLAPVLSYLAFALLIYTYYRALSRNTQKRLTENEAYKALRQRITSGYSQGRQRFTQRNTYRFFRCPSCRQSLRVPKGKGNITVTCPKCGTRFDRKS